MTKEKGFFISKTTNEVDHKNYNEFKWQFALENSKIGIWDFDADLDRVFFSQESKEIIGFHDEDFGTNPQAWNDRVHPDDKKQYFQDFQDHLNGKKPLYVNEHRIQCKDGSYKWVADKGKIIEWSKDGTPKRIIGTHIDITKQKESETSITNSLNLITKQNNKLKNFAHIVTHNLKQHAGNFESLLNFYTEAQTNREKEELVEHLKTLSTSLTKTIGNLNAIVSVQASKHLKAEKIYIAKEVDNILKMLDIIIVKNNATIYNNINDKLFVNYDPSYFESVIQNLLTNAIKYKHPDRDPVISLTSAFDQESKILSLNIKDNGIGIDLDKFGDDIFSLYKTFHHNDDAEGVGLYLIKNQIEAFGGKISVDSKVNVGTTFTITIHY